MIKLPVYVQVIIMNRSLKEYYRWLSRDNMPQELSEDLRAMDGDYGQIEESFYRELEFGTSGIRGIMGPGSNRINQYVVAKVTQGLSNYMNRTLKNAEGGEKIPKVLISYDSRHNSYRFALTAARVFSASGIQALIFREILPVSLLSYGIRYLGCDYGVMITASHNPKEYNGYKVYDRDGCQILTEEAEEMFREIDRLDIFDDVPEGTDENVRWLDDEVKDAYVSHTYGEFCRMGMQEDLSELKVCYSPLNGAGLVPVTELLTKAGAGGIYIVPQQEKPDGDFTTCPKPNPERPEVYSLGLELLREKDADILIVTDPDCDRIGVAEKEGILTGNNLAVLLFEYLCRHRKDAMQRPVAVRSIVSTPLVDAVAGKYGVEMQYTLIGFKYIGQKMNSLGSRFIFGFEEGNGYQAFTHMRDKDGASTALLVCAMAAEYRKRGISLHRALKNIYAEYGYYEEKVINYTFEGIRGEEERTRIMRFLREDVENSIANYGIKEVKDYGLQQKKITDLGIGSFTEFPVSDILEYDLGEGRRFIIRPSGTEPKIKAYFFARGRYRIAARTRIDRMAQKISRIVSEEYKTREPGIEDQDRHDTERSADKGAE